MNEKTDPWALSEQEQAVLEMHRAGKTLKSVAAELGIPYSQVLRMNQSARSKLRNQAEQPKVDRFNATVVRTELSLAEVDLLRAVLYYYLGGRSGKFPYKLHKRFTTVKKTDEDYQAAEKLFKQFDGIYGAVFDRAYGKRPDRTP